MTEQAARYDRIAEGYARWWAPVIAPAALGVLDEIADAVRAGARHVLDVGTGTGTLAVEMVRRWPQLEVTAIDASAGMIAAAGAEAAGQLDAKQRARLDLRVAFADDLGVADASFDIAVSSFVLQLVPSRPRALREVRRVLRPGGVFAWVSWLARDDPWAPDLDFDDALADVGEERREPSGHALDVPTVGAAVAQMRRAGFADVRASEGLVEHPFDVDGYVGFMFEFDEEDLVKSLEPNVRARFEAALRRRLGRRRPHELAMRSSIVTVRGTRR